jgi:hypothetical protein
LPQYNSVTLGLAHAAAACLSTAEKTTGNQAAGIGGSGGGLFFFSTDLMASFLFCLSLNFKQMSLYYSPVFFFHLLGRAWAQPTPSAKLGHLLKVSSESPTGVDSKRKRGVVPGHVVIFA